MQFYYREMEQFKFLKQPSRLAEQLWNSTRTSREIQQLEILKYQVYLSYLVC